MFTSQSLPIHFIYSITFPKTEEIKHITILRSLKHPKNRTHKHFFNKNQKQKSIFTLANINLRYKKKFKKKVIRSAIIAKNRPIRDLNRNSTLSSFFHMMSKYL